jgi:RNA polymerase sigma-70 factor (ECF subfamily)
MGTTQDRTSAAETAPAPEANLNDEDLMGQLAAGRQEALGPLHGRYAALVFNLAAQTIDRATAEEIVQDVFVAVWRKAATFDPARGTFRAADRPSPRAQRVAPPRAAGTD